MVDGTEDEGTQHDQQDIKPSGAEIDAASTGGPAEASEAPPSQPDAETPVEHARRAAVSSPWSFVPLLYFMQAIPVTIVQEVSPIVYKDMGIDNVAITRWTSLIALPWTIKLLWGPLVDLSATKRRWMLAMQALIAISLAGTAFLVAAPGQAFAITLSLLFITAIFSATCDIATDGFYLLSLDKGKQAAFSGVQSTCYRLGRLFCVGLLVFVAGKLQQAGAHMEAWTITLGGGTLIYALGRIANGYISPRPEIDVERGQDRREIAVNVFRTLSITGFAISTYFVLSAIWRLLLQAFWATFGGADPNGFFKGWMLSTQAAKAELAQLAVCLFISLSLFYASRQLLRGSEMSRSMTAFVTQPGIFRILAFMVFYRFGEAMVNKMAALFLKDPITKGGMGLDNVQVGNIVGYAGVVGIVLGGIVGGLLVSTRGLSRSFWFIAIAMHLPNLLYLWAAIQHPPAGAMYFVAFTEQFGYGFGFAGYLIYLMRVAQRSEYRTSHYAIATGLGAMCIMIAGISSGVIQSNFGYVGLFAAACVAAIPGLLTLLIIPIDEPAPA